MPIKNRRTYALASLFAIMVIMLAILEIGGYELPLWTSLLPPAVSIAVALITKEVYMSLFFGVFVGATMVNYAECGSGVAAAGQAFITIPQKYIIGSLTDADHMAIVVFSMLIGGMVMTITLNGGMRGIVKILSRYARTPRSGMLVTWLMGILIFFDDYANTLVVGNTMRPITDKLKISREKLAYLVDSTTAPIAAIAFVTTWIGAELSYIQEGINHTSLNTSAYIVFIDSLGYSFYPILTIIFVAMLIISGRDFGTMLSAERATRAGDTSADTAKPTDASNDTGHWYNAAIPVAIVVLGTIAGLIATGMPADPGHNAPFVERLSAIVGASDSFRALLWASFAGLAAAGALTIAQRLQPLNRIAAGVLDGFKSMFNALVVLTLAWSLSAITDELHTADFIISVLDTLSISPAIIPAITFVIAGVIAFSTGTSWGTMSIVYPLILPAAWKVAETAGLDMEQAHALFSNCVASVLAGAVWGDHCSPISDTTILSSLSCDCNHLSHVRTQMPYAATVGIVSLTIGIIPAALGVPTWLLFIIAIAALAAIIYIIGKPAHAAAKQ